MTHDELLKDIQICLENNYTKILTDALRAVVELHKPVWSKKFNCKCCNGCFEVTDDWIAYPCPTIQAIEKELK